ncbi:MAG: hypothetical protein E6I75_04340 [Chloroflexi bacterium]|nr:MAG: hypothetical protein E6I75_04340 [Chloroflexota bacterium]
MTTFGSTDVLRFLGRRIPLSGDHLPKRFAGEVVSDLHERQEGVRIKHRLNDNSVKRGAAGSPTRTSTRRAACRPPLHAT